MEPILAILFVVAAVVMFTWQAGQRRNAEQAWQQVASSCGLQFVSGTGVESFRLEGTYRGVDVVVRTVGRENLSGPDRLGGNKSTHTAYHAGLPTDVPADLEVFDTSRQSDLLGSHGGQDVEVGDPVVDEAYVIQCDEPDAVREFFDNDEILQAFRDLAEGDRDIHIANVEATIEDHQLQDDPAAMTARLDALVDFSLQIRRAIGTTDEDDEETVANW